MNTQQLLSFLCTTFVGLVFALTGCAKFSAPSHIFRHIERLGIPHRSQFFVAWLTATGEVVLGAALVLRVGSTVLFSTTILLLAVFAALTYWSTATKRVPDCGCYGGAMTVSPLQSVLLDALYAALLLMAFLIPTPQLLSGKQQLMSLGIVAAFAGWTAYLLLWFFSRHMISAIDFSPMRSAKPFKVEWVNGFTEQAQGKQQLVVFIGATCPACKQWFPPLNKISRRNDMPQVIAAMDTTGVDLPSFIARHGIEFPILSVGPATMNRLVDAVPAIVMVEEGIISGKHGAALPPQLLDQLKVTSPRPFHVTHGASVAPQHS